MSRIGNKVVVLPAGVEIKQDGNNITVKGPKGELTREFSSDIKMNIEGNEDNPRNNSCKLQQHGCWCF